MATQIFETVSEMCATALTNYKKISKTCLEVSEQLLQEQVDLSSSLLGAAKEKAGKAASTKDYPSFVSNQAAFGQEFVQQLLKSSQSCAEILTEAAQTCQDLLASQVKTANTNFGATGKKKKA
jgi:hypothetical protein